MKLETKLTAICGAMLLLVAAVLGSLMLWQVKEQSYESLQQRSEESLRELASMVTGGITSSFEDMDPAYGQKVYLRYFFQNLGVDGSALVFNGALVSAPTPIDPRDYLSINLTEGIQSASCSAAGHWYLVSGYAFEWKGSLFQAYLVSDATYIRTQLAGLLLRFAGIALCVFLVGLLCLRWLIHRTMKPLVQLQKTTQDIAAGHYSQRVHSRSKDEVGSLAENFNTMAEAVENHVQSLEEQNARQQLFIGSVTHEFKTPLTALLLNVDTLRSVYLPEEKQQELLESMDDQLHWLEQMVHKLLKLISLSKSAQIKPHPVPQLLEQVETLTKGSMKKYGTELVIQCAIETLPMDQDLLSSALVNLVENSAKASAPGQKILLRAENSTLEVADNGRGIPAKDLERITEPFYMCDPSRSKVNGGFGLGLALVKEIASVHRASLEIRSQPGMGTTVKLVFPGNGNKTVIQR